MSKYTFKSGEWSAICDSCGFKYKSGQMRKRWDGFMVCPDCFEIRHPQDFLRTKPDRQDIPWSRPRPTDVFVTVNYPFYWDTEYTKEGYIEGDTL